MPTLVVSEDGRRFRRIDAARFDLHETDDRIVGFVDPKLEPLLEIAARRHVRASGLANAVTLILEPELAPTDDRSRGVEVTSFLASGACAAVIRHLGPEPQGWCFGLLADIMAQDRVSCDLKVFDGQREEPSASPPVSCDAILPHRGLEAHLRLSLSSLLQQTQPCSIWAAIDQADAGKAFLDDIRDEPRVRAFQLSPVAVGPFVARHVFSAASSADTILFQDSDDLALAHRLATLSSAARRFGAGIVGSHELQLHEVDRKVYAVRYPLDVNAALQRAGAQHQLLFPTSLVTRDVIARVGGFSTFRAFSLDVAFWLNASLTTRIINVDEFLYVRRRHRSSLTMREDIGTASDVRKGIVARRRADFAEIKAGRLSVSESSLAVRHRSASVDFTDLRSGSKQTIRSFERAAESLDEAIDCAEIPKIAN